MNTARLPGLGDSVTWPAYFGHPNDPRAAEQSDTESALRYLIDEAEAIIGKAERSLAAGDMQPAIDSMRAAGELLSGADWS